MRKAGDFLLLTVAYYLFLKKVYTNLYKRAKINNINNCMANLHLLDQKWSKEKINPKYYYEVMGWNIIPVKHGEKGNTPIKWGELVNQRVDINLINQYWTDNTFTNWGVAALAGETSNLMEVDFDDEGNKELWEIFLKTETLKDKTKRGGHLYFQYESSIPAFKKGKLEVKTKGSLLVLPPTLHPTGMERYWMNDLPVQKMSDEFKDWIMSQGGSEELAKKAQGDKNFLQGEGVLDQFSNRLNLPLHKISEGDRFNFLQSMTGKIINIVGHTEEGRALGRLALHKINEVYVDPPEAFRKVEDTYNGLLRTDLRNLLTQDLSVAKEKTIDIRSQHLLSEKVRYNTFSFGFGEDVDQALTPLSLGEVITIYGKASQGKTTFGYNVLLSAKDRFPSVHLKLENSDKNIAIDRFNRWMKQNKKYGSITYFQDYSFNTLYNNPQFPLSDKEHDKCVRDFIQYEIDNFSNIADMSLKNSTPENILKVIDLEISKGKKVFLIDNYTSINFPSIKGITTTDHIKTLLKDLKHRAERHNVLFLGIAHAARTTTTTESGDNAYGSSHYRNISDRLIELKKPTEDKINETLAAENGWTLSEFHIHKNRAGKKDFTIKYFYKPETGGIDIVGKLPKVVPVNHSVVGLDI